VLTQLRDFETVVPSAATNAVPSETHVRVLNGSGVEGAAADALTELTDQGFVGVGTGNADDRGASEILYRPGEQDKAELLASLVRGPVEQVEDDSIKGADVVLVLGAQFEGITHSSSLPATTAPATAGTDSSAPQPASLAPIPGGC
jgi:hypothetical protein